MSEDAHTIPPNRSSKLIYSGVSNGNLGCKTDHYDRLRDVTKGFTCSAFNHLQLFLLLPAVLYFPSFVLSHIRVCIYGHGYFRISVSDTVRHRFILLGLCNFSLFLSTGIRSHERFYARYISTRG